MVFIFSYFSFCLFWVVRRLSRLNCQLSSARYFIIIVIIITTPWKNATPIVLSYFFEPYKTLLVIICAYTKPVSI